MAMGTFEAGGVTYTLRFSLGALCYFEDLTDKALIEAFLEFQEMGEKIRFKKLVPIIQAGLFDTHPNMSEADVMSLDVTDIKSMIDAIGEAAQKSLSVEGEDKAEGNAKAGKKA